MTRKTRSDKGKTRKPFRKESTHIRVDLEKKSLLVKISKMPLDFIKKLIKRS